LVIPFGAQDGQSGQVFIGSVQRQREKAGRRGRRAFAIPVDPEELRIDLKQPGVLPVPGM